MLTWDPVKSPATGLSLVDPTEALPCPDVYIGPCNNSLGNQMFRATIQ